MKFYCYYCEAEKWLNGQATRCEQCGSSVATLIQGKVHAQVAESLQALATERKNAEIAVNPLFL